MKYLEKWESKMENINWNLLIIMLPFLIVALTACAVEIIKAIKGDKK